MATAETADGSQADCVNVQFLDGTMLKLPVNDANLVKDLAISVRAAKPPTLRHSLPKLMSEAGDLLVSTAPAASLVGATIHAVYSASERAFLVKDKDGALVLVDEGDEAWTEKQGNGSFIPSSKWVEAPTTEGRDLENLAQESYGATVIATSNIFNEQEKLNNVLRLGSKFGDPRYTPPGDNSFIFGAGDKTPTMTVDFGKIVVLTRVGSMCYPDRWINSFAVESSVDGESWVSWGRDSTSRTKGGVVFFDREPTNVSSLRIHATSGHVNGARIGPIFAFGYVGDAAVGAPSSETCNNVQNSS